MQTVSVVNHKGGVGKTTTAVSLAGQMGALGQRVLLLDLDPQGSATLSLGERDDGEALLLALQRSSALPIRPTRFPNLELVPSGPFLANARDRFSQTMSRELLARALRNSGERWDWVLIDCPPGIGVLTHTAVRASRHLILPVEANYLALNGAHQLVQWLVIQNPPIPVSAIRAVVPCRAHPRRRVHREAMEQLEALFPGRVTPAVRESAALAEAPGTGQPILYHDPRSSGSTDYLAVAAWVLKQIVGMTIRLPD